MQVWSNDRYNARYRPFSWYEFATARVADNYKNLGKADPQVADYKLLA